MKLSLPPFFTEGNKDAYNTFNFPNTISKSISLSVECLIASTNFTPATLESYHDDCFREFSKITYDIIKANFFVLSGIDKKGKILYIKGVKKDGSYFGLALSYGKQYQYLFDKNLTKISGSFE